MSSSTKAEKSSGLIWLLAAGLATVVLWRVPAGNYIVYPFTILATWFHEMGHGLTAMLVGGDFQRLLLYPNGSGLAMTTGAPGGGVLGRALVAGGGPIGPSVAGALFILAGRREGSARWCLLLVGAALVLSAALWVRSAFGLAAVLGLGGAVLAIGLKAPGWLQMFAIQFLGVQACISVFRQIDYLFTRSAEIGGRQMLTDTGQMAQALILPFWVWGALLSAASLLLLLASLKWAYRPAKIQSG